AALGANLALREIDRLVVVGQSESQAVFEPMGKPGELSSEQEALRARYAAGLAAFRARRWDEARDAFAKGLESGPGDGPSRVLLARVEQFQANPPPADWDGAWHMERK